MKTPEEGKKDNTWFEYYIDFLQINQRLVNKLANKDFNLIQKDHDHQLSRNWYILYKVLDQYFSKSIHK